MCYSLLTFTSFNISSASSEQLLTNKAKNKRPFLWKFRSSLLLPVKNIKTLFISGITILNDVMALAIVSDVIDQLA